MSNTTNLFELPENNTNITMQVNENQENFQPTQIPSLDTQTINSLVNGLQELSETGLSQLPSRDIPMNTQNVVMDDNIQPNYIPPPRQNDYISKQDVSNVVQKYQSQNLMDNFFSEYHPILLIIVLYFLFQLPIVKNKMYLYLPMLFKTDLSYNLQGLIVVSVLFGICYYVLSKTIEMGNYF